MISLWITLIVMGSITAIAFMAIDRAILSGGVDRSFIDPWEAQHKIVYECIDDFNSSQLCLIYSDGAGQRQLTFDGNVPVQYSNPQINSVGQIVAECHDQREDIRDVCLLHTEKPGEVFRIGLEGHENHNPVINDRGTILFDCAEPGGQSMICHANRFETRIHSTLLDDASITFGSFPTLNEMGAFASFCGSAAQQICYGLFGTSATTPINLPSGLEIGSKPLLDNQGNIFVTCFDRASQVQGVCKSTFLSSESTQFVQTASDGIELALFDVTSESSILLTCHDLETSRVDICVAGENSDQVFNVTERLGSTLHLEPSVNDAFQFAYTCGWNICTTGISGDSEQLTDLTEERRASNPDIQ